MIDSPRKLRLERALKRGWSVEEFDRREGAQWPAEKKRTFADVVIDNSGTAEDFRQSVIEFWHRDVAKPT
jgi:dephospho-CoA kinase